MKLFSALTDKEVIRTSVQSTVRETSIARPAHSSDSAKWSYWFRNCALASNARASSSEGWVPASSSESWTASARPTESSGNSQQRPSAP